MRLKNFNLALGSQIFKACADESRLRILSLIVLNGEMCISDLEKILDFSQAKTSRHLIYLKNSGILSSRRYHHWVFYQIKDGVEDIIKQVFQFCVRRTTATGSTTYTTLFTNRELAVNKLHQNGRNELITKNTLTTDEHCSPSLQNTDAFFLIWITPFGITKPIHS
jgi:ArsR family transcriptional regulator